MQEQARAPVLDHAPTIFVGCGDRYCVLCACPPLRASKPFPISLHFYLSILWVHLLSLDAGPSPLHQAKTERMCLGDTESPVARTGVEELLRHKAWALIFLKCRGTYKM